jgi:hypothetical protein
MAEDWMGSETERVKRSVTATERVKRSVTATERVKRSVTATERVMRLATVMEMPLAMAMTELPAGMVTASQSESRPDLEPARTKRRRHRDTRCRCRRPGQCRPPRRE